ncbi:MAG: (2Fe-2S)-binding protein [Arcobacter sp.]|nr:MAG: (2Fe-2S)-binding protein [Arcobacter sp.]
MADFQYSYIVCNCKHVTLGEIVCAIKERNAKTIEDIGKITDAGTACGCCRSKEDDFGDPKMKLYLSQILDKFVQ